MRNLVEKLRQKGFWGLAIALLARIPGMRALNLYHRYSLDLAQYRKGAPNDRLSFIPCTEPSELPDLGPFEERRPLFEQRLKEGSQVLFLHVDGQLAGYLWAQRGDRHVEQRYGYVIPLRPDEIFVYDIFIHAPFRGMGLLRHLFDAFIGQVADLYHVKRVVLTIDRNNAHSIRVHRKLGYKRGKFGLYLDFLGLRLMV